MAGLQLRGGGQVAATVGSYGSSPAPTTATEAAFGRANAPTGGIGALAPNDAAGIAFWWSLVSVGALLFLYFTLPE